MWKIALMAIPLLAACQHTEPGVEIRWRDRPIPQPCLPADKIPDEPPLVADTLTGDWEFDGPVISASALLLREWGQTMHTALKACAG